MKALYISLTLLAIYFVFQSFIASNAFKTEKQKYRVVYMQDGKKVEVFASSLRGVKRIVYGKAQYRIYDSKGSDVTTYFKREIGSDKK